MPTYALWTLIIALTMLAFGLSLKVTNFKLILKNTNEDLDRVVKEIALIKNSQKEPISDLPKLDYAVMEKIFQEYRHQINLLNEIILEMKTPTKYNAYLKEGAKMTLGLAKAIASGDVTLKKDT